MLGAGPARLRYLAAVIVSVLLLPTSSGAKPPGCQETFTRADFHRAARHAYDGRSRATVAERRVLARAVNCQRSPEKSRPIIRFHQARYRSLHLYRLAVNAVTPYGRWAIPAYVVECESHGSWMAYNSSGAAGPYQLMPMWGAPYPAYTRAAKLANHRIAYRLWDGGAGASNWVCV